jgi:hypothetical protein
MTLSDIIYTIGDLVQATFIVFEIIGNSFNTLLVLLGFAGFAYWMNFQRKANAKATIPSEVKDITGWYKENAETKILK